jgi:hypothetical protein
VARKDIIMLSQKELKRLHVIQKALEGVIKQVEAAEMLALSDRQIRRLVKRVSIEGDAGIAHKARGKPSGRRLPVKIRDRVIELYREKLQGFGPTLAAEKVFEMAGIQISDETLRLWLIKEGEWQKQRKGRGHRQWRERKHHVGEMVQMDGSHHDWFEGRGAKCVLMGYIDDATSKVFARFHEYEGTIPAMDSFRRYIRKYGMPGKVYSDKHTTYKSPAKPSIEDDINGTKPLSQFERALKDLGVDVIHAHSPQAKGRIERLFKTFQDRVVKEMRLKGISSIEEANKFLQEYLPEYNRRFAVKPKEEENFHREIPKGLNLDRILCIKTERTLRNDFTISHNGTLYQILDKTNAKKVQIEERINGTMAITYEDSRLRFKEITERPEKEQKKPIILILKKRKPNIPAMNHPWRRFKPVIQYNGYQHKELQT